MKKTIFVIILSSILLLTCGFSTNQVSAKFTDLQKNHWAYNNITESVNKEYFEGYDDGTFQPERSVSRSEAITLLARVLNLDEDVSSYPFNDTDDSWSHGYIGAAYENGILDKDDYGTHFKPNEATTRVELAKWISNAMAHVNDEYGLAIQSTQDTLLPIPEYYTERINKKDIPYVAIMMGTGIMTGYENKEWRPNNKTTRAQMATVLLRLEDVLNKKPNDFFNLRELIEVGETGTNIETVTVYRILEGSEFNTIRNKPITMRTGGGKLYINRIIALDAPVNNEYKSIYANMFIGSKTKTFDDDNYYRLFVEKRLDADRPINIDYYPYYQHRSFQVLVNGQPWDHGEEDFFGLKHRKNRENFDVFMKRIGQDSYYWESLGIDKIPHGLGIHTITVDDGSEFFFRK